MPKQTITKITLIALVKNEDEPGRPIVIDMVISSSDLSHHVIDAILERALPEMDEA